ncbi:MAG: class I SAM-dependent methyltransferase [Verrucomicrobiota bacterium]
MSDASPPVDPVAKAAAVYTPTVLSLYDWWVLGLSNKRIWKCPTEQLLEFYQTHSSADQLEVGVGTGYFPDLAEGIEFSRLVLFDLNQDCLSRAAKRLERFRPQTFRGNILEPLELIADPFESISLNYLLHCLPGALETKAATVVDHLIPFLKEDGKIFGSTILGTDVEKPILARWLMKRYNAKGIFNNEHDSLGAMMEVLSERFRTFNVEVVGCVVLFWAKGLKNRDK